MKNLLFFLVAILWVSIQVTAQVGINTNGSQPDPSAMLDVQSTSKGFLAPRMTSLQRESIANPPDGLMVFCTNCGTGGSGVLSIFSNGQWGIYFFNCPSPAKPTAGDHIPSSNQIIWKWDIVSGATGYKWNTINDYVSATEMGTDTSKTETGLTCNTPYTRFVWAYNVCGISSATTVTQTTSACFTCGSSITIYHLASGGVAPVDKTVTYGTVTNIPGETSKCWITRNLGADLQATAVDDSTEASAGWYWQFNRKQGYKHDGTTRTPNTTWITVISENLDWQAANDPCALELGSGWRIPTNDEWNNVLTSGGWTNWNGPWNSALKMHAAGYLSNVDGSLSIRGSSGYYWCMDWTANSTTGMSLNFSSVYSNMSYSYKALGLSLRCLTTAL